MTELESAEDFSYRIDATLTQREAVALIEADRAAVRLALLEEIRAYATAAYPYSGDMHRRYEHLFAFLDGKYTPPTEVTSPPEEPTNG